MNILIRICKLLLRCLYSLMKLRPARLRIVFLSRQSDTLSYDYEKLIAALRERKHTGAETEIITLLKRQEKDNKRFLASAFQNAVMTLRQMNALSTARVCITDGYSIPVSILHHRKELTVIQIWHAIGAVKKMGLQTLPVMPPSERRRAGLLDMHRGYDIAIAPSVKTGTFFAEAFGLDTEQIKTTGTPHLDYLYRRENNRRAQILKDYPRLTRPVIAYIPTYRSGKLTPVEALTESFDFDKYDLIIRLHPVEEQKRKFDKRAIIVKGYTAEELLSVCDYVITDYSSIAFDAGLMDIPVYFWVYDLEEYRAYPGLNIDPTEEFARYASTDIRKVLRMPDSTYDHIYLKRFISSYIEYYDGKCTERITGCIEKLLH
jgi:CDP-ribitol ribitolphosphotransferase